MTRSRIFASVGSLLTALFMLAGCAAPSSSSSPAAASIRSASTQGLSLVGMKKGLSAEEVRTLLGQPDEVRPQEASGVMTETWIYRRTMPGPAKQVAVDTRDVPYIDPITGDTRIIKELVTKLELTEIEETTGLVFVHGKLMDWRQVRTATKSYR